LSLRGKFTIYLLVFHAVFAGVVAYLLLDRRLWLLAVELVALLSLLVGLRLIHALFAPLALVRSGADLLRETDFTTRFREVGHAELDPLIRVYNRMADHLREERIRGEEQEQLLQRIIAVSPLGIVALDVDARISHVNPAAESLLGEPRDALLGRNLADLPHRFARDLATVAPGDAVLLRWQGRRRMRCQVLTFMDRGFPRRFLLIDELTEELHRTERAAYGKLIRMMSHEVNNTSGAVQSLLESCLAYADQIRPPDRADFERALTVAGARTGTVNRFMQDLAEVVRLPSPRRTACDLRALVERIEVLLHAECTQRRIVWRWEVDGEVPPQRLDAAQMEQALLNVCKNAIEAIGEAGTLTIRIGRDGDRAALAIHDTGHGIPIDVEDQIFTPFFTSKARGQGIGLTLVQEILLGHGCDFALENAASGGAVFTIRFPDR
jgi:nitrogen fixation/metabolism regulation signal transduction histidine kinase